MERDEVRDTEVASHLEGMVSEYLERVRERRSADVKRGMARRKEAGLHSSRVPIGYRRVWCDGEFSIEPDPLQAPLIHQAFLLASTGNYSIRKLHSLMKERGLRHADGRVPSVSGLYRFLTNPFLYRKSWVRPSIFHGKTPGTYSGEYVQRSIRHSFWAWCTRIQRGSVATG